MHYRYTEVNTGQVVTLDAPNEYLDAQARWGCEVIDGPVPTDTPADTPTDADQPETPATADADGTTPQEEGTLPDPGADAAEATPAAPPPLKARAREDEVIDYILAHCDPDADPEVLKASTIKALREQYGI
ncbi:hypothetical protein SEA_MORGANA_8 [Gordonia phage Morgana]|uniref:Head-to-tail connector protein n=1 Tax=Gordonia phage Morgana TaxID=3137292 RepID=A0AAX4RBL5_9CAUD